MYRLKLRYRFLNQLSLYDDVYAVSISQLLDWVKSPTPLSSIADFESWGCPETPSTPIPCNPRRCVYDATSTPFDSERIMEICNIACPNYYPWYGNIFGANPPTPWVP